MSVIGGLDLNHLVEEAIPYLRMEGIRLNIGGGRGKTGRGVDVETFVTFWFTVEVSSNPVDVMLGVVSSPFVIGSDVRQITFISE